MLKGTRSTSLSYQSVIGEKPAVYLSAQIPETGRTTYSKNIVDKELYEQNKAECRRDMAAFDEMMWAIEDEVDAQTAAAEHAEEEVPGE